MCMPAKGLNVGGYQPVPMVPMDVKAALSPPAGQREKQLVQIRDTSAGGGQCCHCHCEYNVRETGQHRRQQHDRHGRRLRRAAHFSFVSVVALALLLFVAFKCRLDQALFGSPEVIHENIGSGLEKRQSTGSTGSSSNGSSQGPFVKNKLYLIIVFVGLLICLILAVMLSAWCCKGAFKNPLCCPCYLCACCGGLACLECISCGLCAEGVEQFDF